MNKDKRNAAIGFHNHAMAVVGQDKQLAYRLLASATTVDPAMASGHYMMGNALADLKMLAASIAHWRRILELPDGDGPGDMTPELRAKSLVNLGHRLFQNGQIKEAYEVSERALSYLGEHPELDDEGQAFARTNMSLVLSIMGNTGASLGYALQAYEMSQEPIVQTGLGFAYLFFGDYAEGLKHFEGRFGYKAELQHYLSWPYPRWNGGKVDRLFVVSEQGLGDTISFARFVPRAAGLVGELIFQVQSELVRLMQGAFSGWPNVRVIPQAPQFPVADAWCPVFSLPTALGLTTEEIREYPQTWRMPRVASSAPTGWKSADRLLHIGIAWGGSAANEIDRWRSIPIERFLELYRVPGVQLYSLQVGERVPELHAAGCASLIRDMSPWIKDVADTVGIMRELDLVVTVESFVGHMAGAMGKECWVPLAQRGGDWRCGRSGDAPLWYPATRLFRQREDGEWGPVFDRIVAALGER